jgi:hypothetical protein
VRKVLGFLLVFGFSLVCLGADEIKPNTDFLVKLEAPGISAKTSAKGDEIRGVVEQPEEFVGYELVGHVTQATNKGKMRGQSTLQFKFEQLTKDNATIPVNATLKQVTNSKGAPDVDEEGRVIKKKSNVQKAAMTTAGGALIGGLLFGGKGALVGAAMGAAAGVAAIEIGAEKGSDFELAADSRLLVTVSPNRHPVK